MAVGASVAAAIIIILTLVCLCMWRYIKIIHHNYLHCHCHHCHHCHRSRYHNHTNSCLPMHVKVKMSTSLSSLSLFMVCGSVDDIIKTILVIMIITVVNITPAAPRICMCHQFGAEGNSIFVCCLGFPYMGARSHVERHPHWKWMGKAFLFWQIVTVTFSWRRVKQGKNMDGWEANDSIQLSLSSFSPSMQYGSITSIFSQWNWLK